MKKACLVIILLLVSLALPGPALCQGPDYSIEGSVWGDVYFTRGGAELSDEARKNLAGVAGWIKKRQKSMVLLAGYDERGAAAAADTGRKRTDAVAKFLADSGVDPSSINSISFGDTKSSGATEAERAKDRRVRYRVVDVKAGGDGGMQDGPMSGVCQRCKK